MHQLGLHSKILRYVLHSAFVQKYNDKSLCSAKKIVPQAVELTQYIMPVRSRLNSKQQAPELGKCLCNLSSDIVLLAALPRKWKNVESPEQPVTTQRIQLPKLL